METREATPEEKAEFDRLKASLEKWRRKTRCTGGAHPECPYCRSKQVDLEVRRFADDLDFSCGDDEAEDEVECEDCGRPFTVKIQFDVTWESVMTDEEFEIEEAKRPDPNQMNLLDSAPA